MRPAIATRREKTAAGKTAAGAARAAGTLLVAASLIAPALVASPRAASASTVSDLRSEVSQVKADIESRHAEAEATSERILELEAEAERLEGQCAESRERLRDAQGDLAQVVLADYKSGEAASVAKAVLSSSTLDEMITNIQYAQSMQESMASKVESVAAERDRLDALSADLERDRQEAKQRKDEFDRQASELEARLSGLDAELRTAVNASLNSIAADAGAVYEAAMVEIGDDPTRKALIDAAYSQIGVPYGYGSYAPGVALDCSGFVAYAYSRIGVSLPHSSVAQSGVSTHKALEDLLPGDLLFWIGTSSGSGSGSHVAMYLGNGRIIHASWEGVIVQNIYAGWNACGSVL